MRIKSYFAATMMEAMAQAREELGEDAVLVSSRRAPIELRHLGEYEVVFGMLPGSEPAPAEPQPEPAVAPPPAAGISEALARLEQQLNDVRAMVQKEPPPEPPPAPRSVDTGAGARLLESVGMLRELAEPLGRRLDARQNLLGPDRALAEALAHQIRFDSALFSSRAVVLAGPGGCGRTSVLVKLAVHEGLARRREVRLISTDLDRVAAGEPLRSYAALLGVPYHAVPMEQLPATLDAAEPGELVLVDTPGLYRNGCRFRLPDDERLDLHLVLPATMHAEDMLAQVDLVRAYHPRTLIFTRFDESSFPGAALSCAIQREMTVSFLSSGGEIPADLAPATAELFAKRILKRRRTQTISAA